MVIGISITGQAHLISPSLDETAPEEIADGNTVRLFMPEGPVHPFQLYQTVLASFQISWVFIDQNLSGPDLVKIERIQRALVLM
jgi:hypothetical protein